MKTVNWTHKRATTFDKQIVTLAEGSGDPIDLTGATILIQLRKQPKGLVAYEIQTTITDATGGEFELDEQFIDIPACNYLYDVLIEFANGVYAGQSQRWINGIFSVVEVISEEVV